MTALDTAAPRTRGAARVQHADNRPTGRQVFKFARQLVEIAGLEWPETRGDASALIERLAGQLDAINATAAPGEFDAGF